MEKVIEAARGLQGELQIARRYGTLDAFVSAATVAEKLGGFPGAQARAMIAAGWAKSVAYRGGKTISGWARPVDFGQAA